MADQESGLGVGGAALILLIIGALLFAVGAIMSVTLAYQEIESQDDADSVRNLNATAILLKQIAVFVAGAGFMVAAATGRPFHVSVRVLYLVLGVTLFFSGFPFHATVGTANPGLSFGFGGMGSFFP